MKPKTFWNKLLTLGSDLLRGIYRDCFEIEIGTYFSSCSCSATTCRSGKEERSAGSWRVLIQYRGGISFSLVLFMSIMLSQKPSHIYIMHPIIRHFLLWKLAGITVSAHKHSCMELVKKELTPAYIYITGWKYTHVLHTYAREKAYTSGSIAKTHNRDVWVILLCEAFLSDEISMHPYTSRSMLQKGLETKDNAFMIQ